MWPPHPTFQLMFSLRINQQKKKKGTLSLPLTVAGMNLRLHVSINDRHIDLIKVQAGILLTFFSRVCIINPTCADHSWFTSDFSASNFNFL